MVRIEQCCCSVSYMLECSDRNIPNKAVVKSLIKHKNFLKAYLNSTNPIHNQHYPNDRILAYSILLEYFFLYCPVDIRHFMLIHITVQCWPIHSELGSQTAQNLAGGSTASYRSRSVWVAGCTSVYSLQRHNWAVLCERKNIVTWLCTHWIMETITLDNLLAQFNRNREYSLTDNAQ